MEENAYAVLGLPEGASVDEIRRAQRRLVFACQAQTHGLERESQLTTSPRTR